MDLGLENRIYLVCGSSRGLGYAIAKALYAEGAKVIMNSRSEERLLKAVGNLTEEIGGKKPPAYISADISTIEGVERLFNGVIEKYGVPDGILINAGGPPPVGILEATEEQWQGAINTNLMSVIRLTKKFVPKMIEKGFGRIAAITSMSAKMPLENLVLSNTTRAAVVAYLRTLANEVGPHGILVNSLLPGTHKTERLTKVIEGWAEAANMTVERMEELKTAQIPLRRFGNPDEFAAVAAFLLSPKNTYVTGQAIVIDGGFINTTL